MSIAPLVRLVAALVLTLGASVVSSGEATGADPLPVVVPGAASVLEGDAGAVVMQVPVTLSEPTTEVVTADWVTVFGPGVGPPAPAEPGVDFASASGTVTFDPGVTATTIEVTVFGDEEGEADEFIVAAFGNPTNATIGGFWGLGFGIIANDDEFSGDFTFAVPFGPVRSPIGSTPPPGCPAIQPMQFTGTFSVFGPSTIAIELCIGEPDASTFPVLSASLTVTSTAGTLTGEATSGHMGPFGQGPFPLVVDFDINSGTGVYTGATGTARVEGTFEIVSFYEFRAFGEFTGSFTIPA
jgi:hypothetical protein